jgi:hypothetical protein
VKDVYGIPFGYRGFYTYKWKNLTLESIDQASTPALLSSASPRRTASILWPVPRWAEHDLIARTAVGGA